MNMFTELSKRILEKRNCGNVSILKFESQTQIEGSEFVNFLSINGFEGSTSIQKVAASKALNIFGYILTKDMAHKIPLMSEVEMKGYWKEIIGSLDGKIDYYTNTSEMDLTNWTGSYDPITDSTFDSCIIFKDSNSALVFIVEDED